MATASVPSAAEAEQTRRWRMLGLVFVVFFAMMEVSHAKSYYLFPIYPLVLAAGAVAIEGWLSPRFTSSKVAWSLRGAVVAVVVLAGVITLPLATWMLSPPHLLTYETKIGFKPAKMEVHHEGLLPQPIGDQFGWQEMVRQVADLYDSLPPAERAKTGIGTGNYGEAGAIDMFGPQYGLPTAISTHQNYWYWGPPKEQYENLIVLQWDREDVESRCTSYVSVEHYEQYGMGEENTPIYYCRGIRFNIAEKWAQWKNWN
jgi:hypothetical protein